MSLPSAPVLVFGLGKRLLSDDAVGPLAIDALREQHKDYGNAFFLDCGSIGLDLLPQIERAAGLIANDATLLGTLSGSARVF